MRRILFYALGLLVVVLVAGFLALGAFPPSSHPVAVDRVLPNTQFK
jgi:hypothetical protein